MTLELEVPNWHLQFNQKLSGCRDSNPESPVPKTGMLTVTLHPDSLNPNIVILISQSIKVFV